MPPAQSERTFLYRIAAVNRVVFVTPEWESFARDNHASQLTAAAVCGRPLFGFFAGRETRHLYQIIIDKVRRDRCTVVIPFRCDGPGVRRFMKLTVSPWTRDQVQFESQTVREEDRETVALMDPSIARDDEYICGLQLAQARGGEWRMGGGRRGSETAGTL